MRSLVALMVGVLTVSVFAQQPAQNPGRSTGSSDDQGS